jgi:ABC-2 type transport system ATP-binding protein
MAFEFQQVGKDYGDIVAVQDVTFGGGHGEILGLLGPNGAGKTTLIRILMDILRPTRGQVMLFGAPHDRRQLDRVGYLPEERGLYTKLKVLDVLVYFGALKGLSRREAKSRALTWLERVGLPEVGSWRVERLSKGMSQKVQIAGTLLPDPELCVLDEPFSGLDPVNVRLVKELMFERRDRGQATVLSTHQMTMVEELCDRVALIHGGRLVVYGTVDEVRRRHTPLEVRVRCSAPPQLVTGVVEVIAEPAAGSYRLRLADQGGKAEHSAAVSEGDLERDTERAVAAVLAELVARGCEVHHFERVLASMEEIFVRVVGEPVHAVGRGETS